MKYVLDTNIFIEANNRYYGIDFCPAFWDWISSNDEVCSIDKVKYELFAREDTVSSWVREHEDLFKIIDNNVEQSLQDVSSWVISQNYIGSAIRDFFLKADYFLIAYAHANNLILITHEKMENTLNKIKIPNVCQAFNVQCMNTFDMLRQERVKFVLS